MLKFLKQKANKSITENGAVTHATTMSDCLDLFATIGALRNQSEDEILIRFQRAYAENAKLTMRILFYARDIRGGLGERRIFKTILHWLADNESQSVIKNLEVIADYGRFDDLLILVGTACEDKMIQLIGRKLREDMEMMNGRMEVSLLAKWLPSVNTSNKNVVRLAKKIANGIGMREAEYRKTLSALRAYIKIIENNIRKKDYTFSYEKQPSKALFKYRKAMVRNDRERYLEFIERAKQQPELLKTSSLTPYDIIQPILNLKYFHCGSVSIEKMSEEEREIINTTWKAQKNFVGCENALVVVDGSGSMYGGQNICPAAVAESLGIYYAERNQGAFHNHFITFSTNPQLIEIKGRDIFEKVRYCMSFNECSNTNLQKTFALILETAISNHLKQKNIPKKLYIISDMEFDYCTADAEITNFEYAKRNFQKHGYRLPEVVFWNVDSRNHNQPVMANEQGVTLVSGCSPQIFAMLQDNDLNPYALMLRTINNERYERIVA